MRSCDVYFWYCASVIDMYVKTPVSIYCFFRLTFLRLRLIKNAQGLYCRLFLATLSVFEKPKCIRTSLFSSPVINFFEVINTILQSFMYVCFISYLTCGFISCGVNKVCNRTQYPVHSVL